MKIGYGRVSTDDQNPDLQLTALKRAGCKRIFTDKARGAYIKRLQLVKFLASLHAGDVLVVWKLDRLGRSLRDLIALLDDLKERGVGVTACNPNQPGLQSPRFQDHINCIYRPAQDHINCN